MTAIVSGHRRGWMSGTLREHNGKRRRPIVGRLDAWQYDRDDEQAQSIRDTRPSAWGCKLILEVLESG